MSQIDFPISRDISDRKKAEDELLRANLSLQERTRQLEEANSMLERLSNLDGLTAISNRRYFEHFYDLEWRPARGRGHAGTGWGVEDRPRRLGSRGPCDDQLGDRE